MAFFDSLMLYSIHTFRRESYCGMVFSSGTEFLKGITDLPIAIVCVIFSVLLYRKRHGKDRICLLWALEFLLIGAAGLAGCLSHCFQLSDRFSLILWCILFVMLFELSKGFYILYLEALDRGKFLSREKVILVSVFEYVCCALSILVLFIRKEYAIFVFAAFGFVLAVLLVLHTKRHEEVFPGLGRLIAVVFLAALAQVLKVFFGDISIVVAHTLVLLSVIILYEIVDRKLFKTETNKQE